MKQWLGVVVVLILMGGSVALASGNIPLGNMNLLTAALKLFKVNAGRYPTQAEGLAALIERPATYPEGKRWMQVMDNPILDPWGHPYEYLVSAELPYRGGQPHGFGLYSKGADGISRSAGNDPDDWNTWTEDGRGRKTLGERVQEHPKMLFLAVMVAVIGIALVSRRLQTAAKPPDKPSDRLPRRGSSQ